MQLAYENSVTIRRQFPQMMRIFTRRNVQGYVDSFDTLFTLLIRVRRFNQWQLTASRRYTTVLPPQRTLFHFIGLQGYAKTNQPIFKKIGGKVVREPRKNPLDFGGNPDHVTIGTIVPRHTRQDCYCRAMADSYPAAIGIFYLVWPLLVNSN